MKTKRLLLAFSITTLIVVAILISLEAYYVVVALVIGTLLMAHREIWSLIRRRKLPPVDERVRENVSKSVRNGFVFLAMALAFLMLPFGIALVGISSTENILAGLFLSGGAVYLLSYLFYDQVEPKLSERNLGMLKIFLLITGLSFATFIISFFLHNALSGLFRVEEPVFFIIAVIISPLAFAVGIIGSFFVLIKGLFSRTL